MNNLGLATASVIALSIAGPGGLAQTASLSPSYQGQPSGYSQPGSRATKGGQLPTAAYRCSGSADSERVDWNSDKRRFHHGHSGAQPSGMGTQGSANPY